jgi:transketolase
VFERQDAAYRQHVIPWHLPRIAVEAGSTGLWWKFVGEHGDVVGIDRFGASAPGDRVLAELGFTPEHVAERTRQLIDDLEELA